MSKRLKLETIVPKELYIKRKADKQLLQIIEDMSRPASILVARQMGKTNLLLNVKRNLESENIIFVYIDLSKIDNDIRDCFRYIVDTLIDTNLKYFENIEDAIDKNRAKNRLPYREHEQELAILLKAFRGKIVIILDEIDSMKKFNFSDQFFSQIRSVYYSSRTNNEDFNNLTYLLSGVLEPSEIIKDKNKSPFNISEKVYLNDFTKKEFNEFIENINFDFFSIEISDRIFYWTSGHPRMIWNISSMLQERFIENGFINVEDVDDVINILYIKHSDMPPVDHIRNLLNENHDMVQILLEIKQEIFLNITSTIKNKLYLYGIIDIDNKNKIEIKNRILDSVLSEDYLKSILYDSKTPFEVAYSLFINNEFKPALTEFYKTLEQDDISKEQKNVTNYYIGTCLYSIGEYESALDIYLEAEFDIETESKMYYQKEMQRGLCFFMLKDYETALSIYNEVLLFKDVKMQINTYINKASIYIYDEKYIDENQTILNIDKAISILDENKGDLEKEYYLDTLAKSFFNKSAIYYQVGKIKEAKEFYNKILDLDGVKQYKPQVLMELIEIDNENLEKYILEINNIIRNNSLKLENASDNISFTINTLNNYIYLLIKNKDEEFLNSFLNYCQNTYDIYKSKCSVLLNCAETFINKRTISNEIYLKCLEYEKGEIGSKPCYSEVYMNLIYNYYQDSDYHNLKAYAFKLIDLLLEVQDEIELNYNHYTMINIIFDELIKNQDISLAKIVYQKVEMEIIDKISKENIIFRAILLDKKYELSTNQEDKTFISKECINIISDSHESLSNFHESTIQYTKSIKDKHNSYLFRNTVRKPILNKDKIGRNDPCSCGSKKKYKKCCG